jgi:hypothetical protein
MRFPWPRRRHDNRNASPEAKAAREQAERSKQQAERDRAQARRAALSARPVVEQAKQHNKANHFDAWLQEQLRNGHT